MNKQFYLSSDIVIKGIDDSVDSEKKTLKIAGYANTITKDRSNDIIVPSAWTKGVENFRKNPILLFQHDQNKPIGKVDSIKIDDKGLHVEASVSSAAEKNYGIQTLINDGALKSFSVGFIPKDGRYDKKTDTIYITDVELVELSVVSIPNNQDSIFSIMKGLNTTEQKSLKDSLLIATESELAKITAELNKGEKTIVGEEEPAKIPAEVYCGPQHYSLKIGKTVSINGERFVVSALPTVESKSFEFSQIDLGGNPASKILKIDPTYINVVNIWDSENNFDLNLSIVDKSKSKEEILKEFTDLNLSVEDLKSKALNIEGTSEFKAYCLDRVNTLITLKQVEEWNETLYQNANNVLDLVNKLTTMEANDTRDFILSLHGYIKEKGDMPNDNEVKTSVAPEVTETKTVETPVAPKVEVSEPRVAQLIEAAGAAMLAEVDAKGLVEKKALEEKIAELSNEIKKSKDAVSALTTSKMVYAENNSNRMPYDKSDVSRAMMLALGRNPSLNLKDGAAIMSAVNSTKFGKNLTTKAVTSVDAFLSDFSTDLVEQMEMELIVTKLLRRIDVPAKTFRIPVADEDTDGDIAQFASGTYTTGIADATNVPTTNQHSISAVELTPHKFMGTTHLAKDEEEDTVLPLIDFLKQATMRRMGRAIDKALLRGDGSLSGFTASPTNGIVAGTGYAAVFKGIVTLANDISALRVATGGNTTKATPAHISSARALLGRYGLRLGADLVYLTTVEGYNELVQNSDFRTVDKFGPNATYLTGAVGAIYGIPILITEFLDTVATNNQVGLLMYKPGFIVGQRRAMEIESEYDPRRQLTAIYMSTRFDMKALTTNANSALDATKYPFAAVVRSNT